VVPSKFLPNEDLEFKVFKNKYQKITPGISTVKFIIHPGFLRIPWYENEDYGSEIVFNE